MSLRLSNFKELRVLKDDMVTHYSQLHREMKKDEEYFDLNISDLLDLPAKFRNQAVVLPTAREVVETAVDHIAPTNRRIEVPRRGASKSAAQQAKLLRRFYDALLTFLEGGPPVSPFREGIVHLTTYGLSPWKFVYDERKWMDEPVRSDFPDSKSYDEAREDWRNFQATFMPFTLQILNGSEVLPDPWHDPPEWVIQVSSKMAGEVKSTYPGWENSRNLKPTTKVNLIEFWSDIQRAALIEGAGSAFPQEEIVEHGWGTHPYIIGSSGLGIDDSTHKPEKRFVGILRYIRDVLLSESRNYSIADIVMRAGAWPVRVAEGERANEMNAIQLEYGNVQALPPGVTIKELTPELPSQMVFQHLQLANNIISAAAAPRVVRGGREPGTRTGFQQQLNISEARLRYNVLGEAVERMMTQVCVKAGIYMEKIVPGAVSLGPGASREEFKSISGRNFRGHHAVKVRINVLAPEDEIRKHQDAINLVGAGLQSPQMAIERLFPEVDPNSEFGRILASRILFSPQIMGLIAGGASQKLATELGLEDILAQILEQARADQQPGRATRTPPSQPEEGVMGSPEDQAGRRQGAILPGREEL